MYTENYSPEEINRIKKIIEIGESQKQIKQSFWDEINTPDVLKLKEEIKYSLGRLSNCR